MELNRRDFLKYSALGVAAGALPRPLFSQPTVAAFTPIRRNVGFFTERGGAIGWLVNDDGVVVVDSQFADTAPIFLQELAQRTSRDIDVLVNSHHHPDHTGGNAVMKTKARSIVAHARAVENQRAAAQRSGNEATVADVTFTDDWSVRIGDETVRAKHFGRAHTGGDAAIFFEEANVLHLGDLLNNRGFPNIDAPAGGTVHGWIEVLETIAPAYAADTVFVFGHAEAGFPFTGTREDLYYQRDYFTAVIDHARRARAEGRSREQATQLADLPGYEHFGGTKTRLGLALGLAYDELAAGS